MIKKQISQLSMLYLWSLVSKGGSEWHKVLKPSLIAKDRKKLSANGLIEEYLELNNETKRKNLKISLSDKGWAFVQKSMTLPVNARSYAAADILQEIIRQLSKYMISQNINLAEIFGQLSNPRAPENLLLLEIKKSASKLADADGSIKLTKIRNFFPNIPKDNLNQTLKDLHLQKHIILYPIEDPTRIGHDDKIAAIHMGGQDMHQLFLK